MIVTKPKNYNNNDWVITPERFIGLKFYSYLKTGSFSKS